MKKHYIESSPPEKAGEETGGDGIRLTGGGRSSLEQLYDNLRS